MRPGSTISATEFVKYSQLDNKSAQRLREELHILGIIDAQIVREQGAVRELEIRLTPLGERIAKHARTIDDILKEASP